MSREADLALIRAQREPTEIEKTAMQNAVKEYDALFGENGPMRQIEQDYLSYVDGIDSTGHQNKVVSDSQQIVTAQPGFGAGQIVATPGAFTDSILDKAIKKSVAARGGIKGLYDLKTESMEGAVSHGSGGGNMARTGLDQVAANAANDAITAAGIQWQNEQDMNNTVAAGVGVGTGIAYDQYLSSQGA